MNHSLKTENLTAPNTRNSGLDQEHAGKTRKVVTCCWTGALWLVSNDQYLLFDWSRYARHLLTLQFDTFDDICPLLFTFDVISLTNFGMFTSSFGWKHAITHMWFCWESASQIYHKDALALYLRSAKENINPYDSRLDSIRKRAKFCYLK